MSQEYFFRQSLENLFMSKNMCWVTLLECRTQQALVQSRSWASHCGEGSVFFSLPLICLRVCVGFILHTASFILPGTLAGSTFSLQSLNLTAQQKEAVFPEISSSRTPGSTPLRLAEIKWPFQNDHCGLADSVLWPAPGQLQKWVLHQKQVFN